MWPGRQRHKSRHYKHNVKCSRIELRSEFLGGFCGDRRWERKVTEGFLEEVLSELMGVLKIILKGYKAEKNTSR